MTVAQQAFEKPLEHGGGATWARSASIMPTICGSIVKLTSATTRVATPGVAPYAAFKGGLDVLTRYMAKEFGDRGIRANAVSPDANRWINAQTIEVAGGYVI